MRQLRNFSSGSGENKSDKDYVNEALNKYGGMQEDELVNALLQNVSKSKESGTYNAEQMNTFMNTVSPFVTPEQREKLRNVIKLINSDDVR